MKTKLIGAFISLLFLTTITSCNEDDDEVIVTNGKPNLLISTTVGESSYYGTIKNLTVKAMDNNNSYEHTGKAVSFIYDDMILVSEHLSRVEKQPN